MSIWLVNWFSKSNGCPNFENSVQVRVVMKNKIGI